ncbi:MAG: MerR family transcriptional regulator [Planctomycetota bacterium]
MEATNSEPATLGQAYTPAMLAECVQAPVAAIRHWHRRGRLIAEYTVAGLAYFGFEEALVARRLTSLLKAGCSLRQIDQRVSRLERACAGSQRVLSLPAVVVVGSDFVLRTDEGLIEPGGQRLMWDVPNADSDETLLRLHDGDHDDQREQLEWELVDEVDSEAVRLEREGRLDDAAEAYRAAIRELHETVSSQSIAALNVSLAAVLLRAGESGAARERYFCAVEADPESLEAHVGLGSVFAATRFPGLAVVAFQKALDLHPEYPDAHFHMAGALDQLGETEPADQHWRAFVRLAPDSPWAQTARTRLSSFRSEAR